MEKRRPAGRASRRNPSGRYPWRKAGTSPDSKGYPCVTLTNGKVRRHVQVHRLVLEAFAGPRQPGQVARHRHGVPSDNRLSQLQWGTQKQNCEDTVRHGRSTRGVKNAQAKLTPGKVMEMRRFRALPLADGKRVPLRELARIYGVSIGAVCDAVKGRTWAHLPGVRS